MYAKMYDKTDNLEEWMHEEELVKYQQNPSSTKRKLDDNDEPNLNVNQKAKHI